MGRKVARDWLFKLVFEMQFQNEEKCNMLEEFENDNSLTEQNVQFVKDMYVGVIEYKQQILDAIAKNLKDYNIDRVFKIDLAILMIAVYELMFDQTKTPIGIIANEACDLANKYSTPKSHKFINGIIANIGKNING